MTKTIKSICVAIVMVATIISITALDVYANSDNNEISTRAGVETWTTGTHKVGEFDMTNTNMTPRKTMGSSGTLSIYGLFYANDEIGHLALDVTVYNRTKGTSKSGTFVYSEGHMYAFSSMKVSKGDVIQIYYDAHTASGWTNPTGAYRKAHVTLSYTLR